MADIASHPQLDDGFKRKKWTVSECRKLVENELLTPGKFELIDGEIVFKMGQGRDHISAVILIMKALIQIFGIDHLQCQAEIGIGEVDEDSDPEPDVAVLSNPTTSYRNREPNPATEILLAVEASLTTLRGDLSTKASIYSKNGVPEYWVVGIERRQLFVHRGPSQSGYLDVTVYGEDAAVSPLAAPHAIVRVADLLL